MPVTEPRNSEGLPLFAQTLEAQRLRQLPPPPDKFFLPQSVLFALPALAIGALLIVARPNIAQMKQNASTTKFTMQSDSYEGENENSARRSLGFYTEGVRGNLFSPPQQPKSAMKKLTTLRGTLPKPPEIPQTDLKPPMNPLQDWAYTGVVTMGESRMALLENTKTKEGHYVKPGDSFMGAQVGTITEQSITLTLGGKPQTLAKSDMINVTPLSANAPFLQSGGQAQIGQPYQVQVNTSVSHVLSRFPAAGTVMETGLQSIKILGEAEQAIIRSAVTNAVNESVTYEIVK